MQIPEKLACEVQQCMQKATTSWSDGRYSRVQAGPVLRHSAVYCAHRLTLAQMTVLMDGEIASDKNQHPFRMQTPGEPGMTENYFNLIKSHGHVITIITAPASLGYCDN